MLIDLAVMWQGVYALTALTLASSQQKKVRGEKVRGVDFAALWEEMLQALSRFWSQRKCGIRAANWILFCTCCFDNQLHIRALSFCGQVLFRSCIVIGPVTLGQAAAFFIVHRLESSTNSPRFVPWQLEVTCFDIGLAQWFGAMCEEPCSLTLQ